MGNIMKKLGCVYSTEPSGDARERFKKAKNLVYIHASINYHPTWDIRSIHKEKNPSVE